MLKLDLLVPLILILCLIALAYILSKVFSPAEQRGDTGQQTEIVLDPDRYREDGDGQDLGAVTNITDNESKANVSNSPAVTSDVDELDDYYQDDSVGEVEGDQEDDDKYYDDDQESPATTTTVQQPKPAPTTPTTTTTTRKAVSSNQYHVIAGSYQFEVLAKQQVNRLKKAGFSNAYLGYTNRGAYAVAVAGSSTTKSEANSLSTKVKAKGFETFVKQGN